MHSRSPSLTTGDVLHVHSSVVGNCVTDRGNEIEMTKMEMAERVSG